MTDEIKDVKPAEAEPATTPSVEEDKQEPIVEEDVKPQGSDVQENLKRALQAERERRKEAENRRAELEKELEAKNIQPQVQGEDEAYQRFVRMEAEVKIQKKINEDPTFKDRMDLVRETMEQTGYDVEIADSIVKASLYEQLVNESVKEPRKEAVPNQLKPQANPEPVQPKSSGNLLDDVVSGKVKVDPALRATIMKYRNKE